MLSVRNVKGCEKPWNKDLFYFIHLFWGAAPNVLQNWCPREGQYHRKGQCCVVTSGTEPHTAPGLLSVSLLICVTCSRIYLGEVVATEFGVTSWLPRWEGRDRPGGPSQGRVPALRGIVCCPLRGNAGLSSLLTLYELGTLEGINDVAQIPFPFPKSGKHWRQEQ